MTNINTTTTTATFDLQLFAGPGSVVNATTGYVNAYDGTSTPFSGKDTMEGEVKTYYDTELLENAKPEMVYAQFAKRQPLPAHHGKTVEWRKFNTFDRAERLVEGVIPNGQKFGMSTKTGAVNQYGTYVSISDRLETRGYDAIIAEAAVEMGHSAALTQETLIRDALAVNPNVMYCDVLDASGDYVSTPVSGGTLYSDATNGYAYLTPAMVSKAATWLKKNQAPTIDGRYVAVIHPSVTADLRANKDWIMAHVEAAPEAYFTGEIGELHGVRFVESNLAPVLKGADLSAASRELTADKTAADVSAVADDSHAQVLKITNTLTADDQAALAGRMIIVDGVVFTVYAAKSANELYLQGPHAAIDMSEIADAKVYPGEGGAKGAAAYATYFFGAEPFGIVDPEDGGMHLIAHDKGEIGGPLNQFSTVGYKLETNGATILYPERMLRVMSASTYSASDEAN